MFKSKEGLYYLANLISVTAAQSLESVRQAKSGLLTSYNPQEYTGVQDVPFLRNAATVGFSGSYSNIREDVTFETKNRTGTFSARFANRGSLAFVTLATATVDAEDAVKNAKTALTRRRAVDKQSKLAELANTLNAGAITKFIYLAKDGRLLASNSAYNIPSQDVSAYRDEVKAALLAAMPGRAHNKIDNAVYVDKLLAKGLIDVSSFYQAVKVTSAKVVAAANAEQIPAVSALFAYFRDVEDADVTVADYLDQYVADVATLHAALTKYESLAARPVNPYHITSTFSDVVSTLSGKTISDSEGQWLYRMLRDAATGEYTTSSDGVEDYYDAGDYLQYPGATLTVTGDTITVKMGPHTATARLGVPTPTAARCDIIRTAFKEAVANAYGLIFDSEAPHFLRWARLNDFVTKPFLRM